MVMFFMKLIICIMVVWMPMEDDRREHTEAGKSDGRPAGEQAEQDAQPATSLGQNDKRQQHSRHAMGFHIPLRYRHSRRSCSMPA